MESTLATPLEAAYEMEIKGEWLKNNTSISSVAEGARFELADPLRGLQFSRLARSATPSPLQTGQCGIGQ